MSCLVDAIVSARKYGTTPNYSGSSLGVPSPLNLYKLFARALPGYGILVVVRRKMVLYHPVEQSIVQSGLYPRPTFDHFESKDLEVSAR